MGDILQEEDRWIIRHRLSMRPKAEVYGRKGSIFWCVWRVRCSLGMRFASAESGRRWRLLRLADRGSSIARLSM